ncbi:MAG: penicillin-binding protein [Flavobacteriales bacterium]
MQDIYDNHINQPANGTPPSAHNEGAAVDGNPSNAASVYTRAYMVFAALCVFALAITIKVFVLQLFPSDEALSLASNFSYKLNEIEPVRGRIISSDGTVLASSIPEYEVRWDSGAQYDKAAYKAKIDSLTLMLSQLFGDKSSAGYRALFREAHAGGNRYALIHDHVNANELQAIKQFPFAKLGQFKSGFIYVEKQKRDHSFKELATRTVGYGRAADEVGIELAYNKVLAGKKGKQLQEKIPGGFWKPISDDYEEEPETGNDVVTTIDIHLQDVAHHALLREVSKHNAEWGCAILMEVETGFVRAIANISKDQNGNYGEHLNMAISQSEEPGSTMKLASLMAALDDDLVSMDDSVATGHGEIMLEGRRLTDSNLKEGGNGTITAEQVFEKSSNIGTALLIKKAYGQQPQKFLDKLNGFGLNKRLAIDLYGESTPTLYKNIKDKGWSGVSLTQLSIGYETSYTPLQTLAFYNAVANNGTMVRPQFVQSIQKNGRAIEEYEPIVLQKGICKSSTIKKVKQMMEGVMEEGGTADWVFAKSPYKVAGKTGTCKIHADGAYQENRYRASFVGYFPAEDPKYSCIVVIHDPRSGVYYGSAVAAPVFKELADKIYSTQMEFHKQELTPDSLALAQARIPVSKNGSWRELNKVYQGLGIPTEKNGDGEWAYTTTKKDSVIVNAKTTKEGLVPNVVGMGLQDALYLLEQKGMRVQVLGYGTVKRQSVQPGATIKSTPYITIELS